MGQLFDLVAMAGGLGEDDALGRLVEQVGDFFLVVDAELEGDGVEAFFEDAAVAAQGHGLGPAGGLVSGLHGGGDVVADHDDAAVHQAVPPGGGPGDVTFAARAGGHDSFVLQPLKGVTHGRTIDGEGLGELALGGQAIPAVQVVGLDQLSQAMDGPGTGGQCLIDVDLGRFFEGRLGLKLRFHCHYWT